MLKNYLKIAWRNLWKQKLFAFVNIGGLGVGMAVSLLILVYVAHELSYDRFHEHAGRVFRVLEQFSYGEQTSQSTGMSAALGPAIRSSHPSVEDFVRTDQYDHVLVGNPAVPEKKFYEDGFLFADSSFFKVFSFRFIKGNPHTALTRPHAIVLTRETADKYFGNEDPLGKHLLYENNHRLEVTGVIDNVLSNSTVQFQAVASFTSLKNIADSGLYHASLTGPRKCITYLQLKNPEETAGVEQTIARLYDPEGKRRAAYQSAYSLEPLTSLHLKSEFTGEAREKYVYIFGGIGLLILLLALVNYMSISTSRATYRAREIGVRKVAGAGRERIVRQFYTESVLHGVLAFVLAVTLTGLINPVFLHILDTRIDSSFYFSRMVIGGMLCMLMLAMLLAGSYPSLVLSSFKPAEVLKGQVGAGGKGAAVRKVFITFQFVAAVGLIICSLVIGRQMRFFHTYHIGLNKDQVLVVPLPAEFEKNYTVFREQVGNLPGVQQLAGSGNPLFKGYDLWFSHVPDTEEKVTVFAITVDEDFFNTLQVAWKRKPEDGHRLTAEDNIIINEQAITKFKLPADPVGKQIKLGNGYKNIAGVVTDFNFLSLKTEMDAILMNVRKRTGAGLIGLGGGCLYIKWGEGINLPALLSSIRQLYESYPMAHPFEYYFLDDSFNEFYKNEEKMARLFSFFTACAIFIACLGLFGLAAFTAEQRTKEIGIRKVLGASVAGVVALLSRDFIKLVLIAIVIATPIAWYAMNRWLEDFAYRIEIRWWILALAGLLAVVIALLTVSFQSVKAALMNPVKSLKSE